MVNTPIRLQLYAKDIMIITGLSERSARRLIKSIKEKFSMAKMLPISVDQFCEFTGIKEEKVQQVLR